MFVYTISDLIGVAVFVLVVVIGISHLLYTIVKQKLCRHEKYFENGQCHAICRNCGKDLGFIGNIRDKK